MNDPEMRKDCPMRGSLGNCSPVGGFCMDAVSDEICEAVHNAYNHGFCNALRTLKEQEAVEPILIREGRNKNYNDYVCPRCDNEVVYEQNYCSECGVQFLWEGW